MSPLKYSCKSPKLVLCICRLQLTSGLAFLKGKRPMNSHLQLITSATALGLHSTGGEARAAVAAWGASKTGLAELIAVFCR